MKRISHLMKSSLAILLTILLCSKAMYGQISKDEAQLQNILNSVNKRVYVLLRLSKDIRENASPAPLVEKIRIISIGCPLISDLQNPTQLPDELIQSQEFTILDYQDRHYQIETTDGQTGWVSENCTERFLIEDIDYLKSLGNIMQQNQRVLIELAQNTYSDLLESVSMAERFKKRKLDNLNTSSQKERLVAIYTEILNKKGYADAVFTKYFKNAISSVVSTETMLQKLSVRGQVALGSSNFTKSYFTAGSSINKSGNTDFKLDMKYQLDPNTNLSLNLGKRKESLQSVYSNGFAGLGFQRRMDKMDLGVRLRFNNYNDIFRDLNSYKRINLNAKLGQEIGEKTIMTYGYNLLNNSFVNKEGNDYSKHALFVKARIRTQGSSFMEMSGNADFSSSELSFFKYKRFKPQFVFSGQKLNGGQSRFVLYSEIFSFDLVPLRSNNKYFLGYNTSKPSENNAFTKSQEISFLLRQFPNSVKNNFYQLKLGTAKRVFGKGNKQLSTQLITRYFPENVDFSHVDLHLSYHTNSQTYYSLTSNIRYWYPGDQNFITTDLYAKVGVKIKTISISPTLGLHANTDLKSSEFSLKSDKNNIRAGIEARGNLRIARIIKWNFRAAYEYGFVYNLAVESFGDLGQIVYGEVLQRNPHSLQIQSDVSAQVLKQVEVYGSFRYFNYETDIISQLSISPVVNNNRLSVQFGVRFRYN